jgi:hypothetical protein
MTLADPLRVVLVGAGSMGRAWRDTIESAPDVELAGIADIHEPTARAAAEALGRPLVVGTDAVAPAAATGARLPPPEPQHGGHTPVEPEYGHHAAGRVGRTPWGPVRSRPNLTR